MPEEHDIPVGDDVMTRPLTVYITRPAAPLCERVCAFLEGRGYAFTTIDVVTDQDREAMRERTGYTTCPLVLVGDHVVGKLADTIEADRSGRLADLLAAADQIKGQDDIRDA
jgi:glutaredoxin